MKRRSLGYYSEKQLRNRLKAQLAFQAKCKAAGLCRCGRGFALPGLNKCARCAFSGDVDPLLMLTEGEIGIRSSATGVISLAALYV
jgi:hypothetical protein